MRIETLQVAGFEPAINGIFYPLTKKRSDSYMNEEGEFILGVRDRALTQSLLTLDLKQAKFMNQISVWVTITMPIYWWNELSKYKQDFENSCSTFKASIFQPEPLCLEQFSYDIKDEPLMRGLIEALNEIRLEWSTTENMKEKISLARKAKTLLPEGFLQTKIIILTYAELRTIYQHYCKHQSTPEWKKMLTWIETLPYAEDLIIFNESSRNSNTDY
ncbi:Uncharacterised protein [Turicibacter sanguinis]|nr:Uncharacterised protein [Turicibacter sanguinis]